MPSPTAYELYRSGVDLLEQGDNHAAALPLSRARDLEPTTAMVREALGRALFASQRYREAAEEFGVLVELEPLNDYGQFCLGRALQLQGLHALARPPLTLAALLQPARRDYAMYRDRTIAALSGDDGTAATAETDGPGVPAPAAPPPPSGDAAPPRRSGAGPWGSPAVARTTDDPAGNADATAGAPAGSHDDGPPAVDAPRDDDDPPVEDAGTTPDDADRRDRRT